MLKLLNQKDAKMLQVAVAVVVGQNDLLGAMDTHCFYSFYSRFNIENEFLGRKLQLFGSCDCCYMCLAMLNFFRATITPRPLPTK